MGLYSIDFAARLAGADPKKVARWLFGAEDAVLTPTLPSEERIVTFVNLIEIMAVAAARRVDISLQGIRSGIKVAEKAYRTQHVLARRCRLFKFGTSLIVELAPDTMVGVSRKVKHQAFIPDVVNAYASEVGTMERKVEVQTDFQKKVQYDAKTGLPVSFELMKNGPASVVLNPAFRMGAPRVLPTGLMADTLLDALRGEGSIEAAARAYEVTKAEIRMASQFEAMYRPAA